MSLAAVGDLGRFLAPVWVRQWGAVPKGLAKFRVQPQGST